MIRKIKFDDILHVWSNLLWPTRTSKIESNSAMCLLGGYDMYNMTTEPTFFGYWLNGDIIGVNSGHMCKDNHYRSRGLYVKENFRGLYIGRDLLLATIEQGRSESASLCWSYPRQTSWNAYKSAGFTLVSDWEASETSDSNAYCRYDY